MFEELKNKAYEALADFAVQGSGVKYIFKKGNKVPLRIFVEDYSEQRGIAVLNGCIKAKQIKGDKIKLDEPKKEAKKEAKKEPKKEGVKK